MKYNLLKMTQLILSAMDSDEINDISDTAESLQVVDIIETVYNENSSELLYPEHKDFFELAATDATTPTILTRPTNVIDMTWFKYNHQLTADADDNWVTVNYVDPDTFMERMNTLAVAETYNEAMTFTNSESETFVYRVCNTRMPSYYMLIDDHYIICDSYVTAEETNLQKTNTWCYGRLSETFTRSNTFSPNIDEYNYAQFFNECKSQCFADLKQTVNIKSEKKSRDGKIRTQKRKYDLRGELDPIQQFKNFGRKQ